MSIILTDVYNVQCFFMPPLLLLFVCFSVAILLYASVAFFKMRCAKGYAGSKEPSHALRETALCIVLLFFSLERPVYLCAAGEAAADALPTGEVEVVAERAARGGEAVAKF